MKNVKRLFVVSILSLVFAATTLTALATSTYTTPAEAFAGVTGKTVESAMKERKENGKSYGAMAKEEGKLDEFKREMLEMKKSRLTERVEAGNLTKEKADTIIKAIEEKQGLCDGTGVQGRFGGAGQGQSAEHGKGQGGGHGMKNGECVYK